MHVLQHCSRFSCVQVSGWQCEIEYRVCDDSFNVHGLLPCSSSLFTIDLLPRFMAKPGSSNRKTIRFRFRFRFSIRTAQTTEHAMPRLHNRARDRSSRSASHLCPHLTDTTKKHHRDTEGQYVSAFSICSQITRARAPSRHKVFLQTASLTRSVFDALPARKISCGNLSAQSYPSMAMKLATNMFRKPVFLVP